MSTATVTVRGVPLEVDYHVASGQVVVEEIRCSGHEILCFFDDKSLSEVERAIIRLEVK